MSNKQRIAFLCHPYHRGGVTRWMADAAIAFAKSGFEVYFITVEPTKEFYSAKGRETLLQLLAKESSTINILKANAGSEFEFGTNEYRAYVYSKQLSQLPVGTPVVLSDDSAVWEAAVSLYRSYPIIGVLHADEEQYYLLAEKYCRQVAALVCVSYRVNKNTQKRVPEFDKAHLATIPCGINLPDVTNGVSGNSVLQLVYVGRVSDYQKRTGDLVHICRLLTSKNVSYHLTVIGDGEARPSLESSFKENGLTRNVTFSGWLSQQEVSACLSRSDILLLTSDFEGMPIAMMEALAAGCAVVGTRVSGIEDYEYHPLAADCLSAFTVGDIEDAVSKINELANRPSGIRQQTARKLAEAEFSIQVCLEKYQKVMAAIKTTSEAATVDNLPLHKRLYSNLLSIARNIKVSLSKQA